jgi:DNA-directed RNA polymerase specialized sigma24 family protein
LLEKNREEDTDKRQERFEDSVMLESDMITIFNSEDEEIGYSIDNIPFTYMTLAEVMSEYGRDIDFENRKSLNILINERLKKLSKFQRKLAELRYIENKTYRDIQKTINKSLSTIHYHMNKIDKILCSIR